VGFQWGRRTPAHVPSRDARRAARGAAAACRILGIGIGSRSSARDSERGVRFDSDRTGKLEGTVVCRYQHCVDGTGCDSEPC
jgi:hypothetical protein